MILIFFVLLFLAKKLNKQNGLTPSLFVVYTYMLSTIIGIVCRIHMPTNIYTNYNYFSMVYYALNLFVLLLPLFKNNSISDDFFFPNNCIQLFSIILIVGGLMAVLYEIVEFDFGVAATNWSDVRSDYYANMEDDVSVASSLYGKIGANFEHILFFAVPLAFYNITKKKNLIAILLLFVSTSVLLHSLRYGERQSLLLWLSYIIMSYLLFKNKLSKKTKKYLKISLMTGGVFVLLLVASITMSRFGGDGDDRLIGSLYAYSGVQPYNAAYFLENLSSRTLGGRLNFPFLVGGSSIYVINDFFVTDFYLNSFSSIIGSYYKDFGYYTIIVSTLVSLFFLYLMNVSRKGKSLLYLYIYCVYFNMMFVGVFYNKFTSPTLVRNIVVFGLLIWLYEQFFEKRMTNK